MNRSNAFGEIPLIYSAKHNQWAILEFLLENPKIDINAKDSKGKGVLEYVVTSESEKGIKIKAIYSLMQKGVMPIADLFFFCAVNNFQREMRYCLIYGVDVNAINKEGENALSLVEQSSLSNEVKASVIKILLRWGSNPNYWEFNINAENFSKEFKQKCYYQIAKYKVGIIDQLHYHLLFFYGKKQEIFEDYFIREILFWRAKFLCFKKSFFDRLPTEIQLMILEEIMPSTIFSISSKEFVPLAIDSASLDLSELSSLNKMTQGCRLLCKI